MSRKTRKLIWSAPLVAVLAVAGVLAIFVALSPQEAAAHEAVMHGAPGPVSGLTANPATDDPNTPKPEGRNAITLTWEMPTSGGAAETYRIDISEDTRVWINLVAAYTDASAEAHCPAGSADNLRCYTSTNLEPGTRYNYRVFAENTLGIGPVSVDPAYDFAITSAVEDPSRVVTLKASTTYEDKIVLNWSAPEDDGGNDVLWYCLAVANPTGVFAGTLTDDTCREALSATAANAAPDVGADGAITEGTLIVVPGSETSYEHTGLDAPTVITLRYRAYAVTDPNGMADTIEGRRLAQAASNIATGRTMAPGRVFGDPPQSPLAVRNLRAVVFGDSGGADFINATANLYWNKPTNYPDDAADRVNWRVEIQEWSGTVWGDVDVEDVTVGALTPPAAGAAPAQLIIANADLVGDEPGTGTYQVRYVIDETPGDLEDNTSDVKGVWADVKVLARRTPRLPLAPTEGDAETGLPFILAANGNAGAGLRFRHGDNPRTEIDLFWNLDNSVDTTMNRLPTGYVLDVSEDSGITWEPLRNVTSPRDLGATVEYTHRNVVPGKRYTYRVFPEQGHAFGLPKSIHASSEGAEVPDPVDGLTVRADGQKALVLNWDRLPTSGNGGQAIMGYLVQVSLDADNDADNDHVKGPTGASPTADWMSLDVVQAGVPAHEDYQPWTVDPSTRTYRYEPKDDTATTPDESLSAGNLRWFRVIAITAENDGRPTTGGQNVDVADGSVSRVPTAETSPTDLDIQSADEESGRTDSLPNPGPSTPTTPPPAPVDLTAEVASDTNEEFATDRGVLLLWNEPKDGDDINSYVIQRSVNGAAFETIGAIEWLGRPIDERTSYTDELEPAADEVRMYQVGSRSSATGDPSWSDPVMYPTTHVVHEIVLTAPDDVMATDTTIDPDDLTIEVTWTPGENAVEGHIVLLFTSDFSDVTHVEVPTDDGMYTITGVAAGDYVVVVVAVESRSNYLYGYDRISVGQ